MNILRPLLAAKTTDEDLQRLKFPMLLSPKIDGIRALVVGGKLVSRTLKLIPNKYTQGLFGRPEYEGLDGELVVGNPWDKNLMQQTTSGVMSQGGEPNVTFHVFDKWDVRGGFLLRNAASSVLASNNRYVYSVPHEWISSHDALLAWEHHYLGRGYEGVMLRSPTGPYKQGRSTLREGTLLKVKRFHDAEATIISYEPLYRNLNSAETDERGYTKRSSHQANKVPDELLGSITVKCKETGQVFDIGTGFTEAQRISLWRDRQGLLGRVVTYKSFKNAGVKDKPRFPIFVAFRSPLDM